jgi:hypothetical protein
VKTVANVPSLALAGRSWHTDAMVESPFNFVAGFLVAGT